MCRNRALDRNTVIAKLREHSPKLRAAGLAHGRVFGLTARGESCEGSDVDLLVEFDRSRRRMLVTVGSLQTRRSEILAVRVDLPTEAWRREPVRSRAREEAILFKDDASRCRDILGCISLIRQFTAGMDFEAYVNDEKTRPVVERQILILSGAAKHPGPDAETQCPEQDWKGFRGMGDILRHAYHRVDDKLVRDSVTQDLPPP
ncbi:MAG TPA: HepT-like ribonuclease domain-containing protein [Acidobacteriaceae bacterium]|nr:HepT-like ribonuclease domain-containing protein [Acidobacteriaceae bacterium]